MNKEFLEVLKYNKLCIQKYFYDSLSTPHPLCDGHIIAYNKKGDNNNWLKIRKTTLEIDDVTKELTKNNFKIILIQKTEYLNKCKNLIELLFNYAKTKRPNGNKQEEWIKFNHQISISNIIMSLLLMMNDNVVIPSDVKQYKCTDSELKMMKKSDDDSDEEFFAGLVGGILIGGLIVGVGALISKVFSETKCPSSIKQGISCEILELILLDDKENPMYYYTSGKIHILLTDMRFVKIENYCIVSEIHLDKMKYVKHIKNSIFHFDKIEILEESGRLETFGIYEKEVCEYFTNLLNGILREIKHKKSMVKAIQAPVASPKIEVIKEPVASPKIEVIKEPIQNPKIEKPPIARKFIKAIEPNKYICSRCLDKYEEKSIKINCMHKDICIQCISMLKKCPECLISYT